MKIYPGHYRHYSKSTDKISILYMPDGLCRLPSPHQQAQLDNKDELGASKAPKGPVAVCTDQDRKSLPITYLQDLRLVAGDSPKARP